MLGIRLKKKKKKKMGTRLGTQREATHICNEDKLAVNKALRK